ncbi:unnamed protein product, partial [Aureobasidium vineae]
SRHHDTISGLSWNETVITTSSRPLSSQIYEFLHRPVGRPPRQESATGVDALETMAMRCLLNNLDMLEVDSLEHMPEMMLKRVWQEISRSNLQSLHLWQTFMKTSPPLRQHQPTKQQLNTIFPLPPHSLNLYLSTPLSHLPNPRHHHRRSKLIISLHLVGCSSSTKQTSMITDDTIRSWNKKAKHSSAFPCLKMLFLRFQLGITDLALGELDGFKQLEMAVTSRCGVSIREGKKIGKEKGWKMTSKAFYAHAEAMLEDKPSGKNYLDVVNEYITSTLASSSHSASSTSSPPLSLIQLGRQPPTASTNILFTTNEIECWVKDDEQNRVIEAERKKRVQEKDEAKQKNGMKRMKIKEAKKRVLFQLLEGM